MTKREVLKAQPHVATIDLTAADIDAMCAAIDLKIAALHQSGDYWMSLIETRPDAKDFAVRHWATLADADYAGARTMRALHTRVSACRLPR